MFKLGRRIKKKKRGAGAILIWIGTCVSEKADARSKSTKNSSLNNKRRGLLGRLMGKGPVPSTLGAGRTLEKSKGKSKRKRRRAIKQSAKKSREETNQVFLATKEG